MLCLMTILTVQLKFEFGMYSFSFLLPCTLGCLFETPTLKLKFTRYTKEQATKNIHFLFLFNESLRLLERRTKARQTQTKRKYCKQQQSELKPIDTDTQKHHQIDCEKCYEIQIRYDRYNRNRFGFHCILLSDTSLTVCATFLNTQLAHRTSLVVIDILSHFKSGVKVHQFVRQLTSSPQFYYEI